MAEQLDVGQSITMLSESYPSTYFEVLWFELQKEVNTNTSNISSLETKVAALEAAVFPP